MVIRNNLERSINKLSCSQLQWWKWLDLSNQLLRFQSNSSNLLRIVNNFIKSGKITNFFILCTLRLWSSLVNDMTGEFTWDINSWISEFGHIVFFEFFSANTFTTYFDAMNINFAQVQV